MPKLVRAIPKYRKHKQSGRAIVTISGRDHLLGPHGTQVSKSEYDRLIAEWLASGRSTSFGAPVEPYTVVELVVDYLNHAEVYYGSSPRGTYPSMVRACRPLRLLYSRLPVEQFGVAQFKTIRQQLVANGV